MTNNKNATRYYSSRHEKQVSATLAGRTSSNSGAARFSAGDVETSNFLVECKTLTKPKEKIVIKLEWLEKIKQEAIGARKPYTTLCFNFGDNENYYIIDSKLTKVLMTLKPTMYMCNLNIGVDDITQLTIQKEKLAYFELERATFCKLANGGLYDYTIHTILFSKTNWYSVVTENTFLELFEHLNNE